MNFMKATKTLFGILTITAALVINGRSQTTPIRSGFDQQTLDRCDDGSTGIVPLGFLMNFYGDTHTALYVNNNGSVTFDGQLPTYVPTTLLTLGTGIIAPFRADVDTRDAGSDVVKYGTGTVNGCAAFGVDWVNVGYYAWHSDKLLSCQLVIIDRSDIAAGDFDLEFNYEKVQWQWGDVTVNNPPRAGFANGISSYELPGSGMDGAFLDSNPTTGLIYNSLNSSEPGRYDFSFRDGIPVSVPEPTAATLVGMGLMVMVGAAMKRFGRNTVSFMPH
jgi:hypothetical protein